MRHWILATLIGTSALPLLPVVAAEVKNVDYDSMSVSGINGLGAELKDAIREARAQAILKGVEKLAQTPAEKQAFEAHRQAILYDMQDQFVKSHEMIDKFKQSGKTGVEIDAVLNLKAIREALISRKVIQAVADIASELGAPKILAYFEFQGGQRPDVDTGWAIDRVNNYFQAHDVEVVLKEEVERLMREDNEIKAAKAGSGLETMAKKAAADVFIRVKGEFVETRQSGDYRFAQATVSLEAVDTGTQKVLATANGQSRELAIKGTIETSRKAAIEEAVGGVSDQLFQDLLKGWKVALADGRTYLLVIKGSGNLAAIKGKLGQMCTSVTEKAPGQFQVTFKGSLSQLGRTLRKEYNLRTVGGELSRLELAFK